MNPLSGIAGMAVDRMLGIRSAAVPYVVRADVAVEMPDGVALLGDLYRPAGDDRPLPVVLIRSPYGRSGLAGVVFAAPLARRGFQVFIQSIRGTFGSGGLFRPFTCEREDGLATLAWLRDQPWCDGQVAMTGASYLGHTQWAIAPYADPPLRSVCAECHSREDQCRVLSAWRAQPAERAELDRADRQAGTWPARRPAEPAADGADEAGAAEDPAAGRRR